MAAPAADPGRRARNLLRPYTGAATRDADPTASLGSSVSASTEIVLGRRYSSIAALR
jgi:hypothetical protein